MHHHSSPILSHWEIIVIEKLCIHTPVVKITYMCQRQDRFSKTISEEMDWLVGNWVYVNRDVAVYSKWRSVIKWSSAGKQTEQTHGPNLAVWAENWKAETTGSNTGRPAVTWTPESAFRCLLSIPLLKSYCRLCAFRTLAHKKTTNSNRQGLHTDSCWWNAFLLFC